MRACVAVAALVAVIASTAHAASCGGAMTLDVRPGQYITATARANLTCPDASDLVIYALSGSSGSSALQVNARGDMGYTAPDREVVETFVVAARCNDAQTVACDLTVRAMVARELTQPPQTASPAAAVTECPQLFFPVTLGDSVSDSIATPRTQLRCSGAASFQRVRSPVRGTLLLAGNGDFRFDAPATLPSGASQSDDFGYAFTCDGAPVCRGSAYFTFVAATPAPTVPSAAPGASQPSTGGGVPASSDGPVSTQVVRPRPYMQCRGTCNHHAWKAAQSMPNRWDVNSGVSRADGKAVDGVETSWVDGKLVIKAYSVIGNYGVRFPTFEEISVAAGDIFSDVEVRQRVAASSVPFDISCLGAQSAAGLGANVWEWESVANLTGRVGRHYKSGSDWYQKFGGKHDNCDTFMENSCHYAPLLTPPATQDGSSRGVWSVDIDGCDVTWTGVFSFAAMRSMRRVDGTPVFEMSSGHYLRTNVLTEAVKPVSEVRPAAGVATAVSSRDMILDLEPWTTAGIDAANHKLFSVDVEYFQYRAEGTGDRAFGLNLLFYPHVDEDATSSYMPDRHVAGFRWVNQRWSHPDALQCPTCTGTDAECAVDASALQSDSSFLVPAMPVGNCRNPRVVLSRGPEFAVGSCPSSRMHNFGRPGFSAPQYCRRSFQNITIRGIAPGSAGSNASESFAFEGGVQLQLLLDNGMKPVIDINMDMIVGMSSVDGVRAATSEVCRSGSYWPVLDPLGSSLPDKPHRLSTSFESPADLCVDRDDSTFGPTGWALVTYDVAGATFSDVTVESLTARYPGSPVIFLRNSDPATGRPSAAIPEDAVWWNDQFPFLNFRDLSARLPNQTFTVGTQIEPIDGQDYAFAFTPGAIGVAADLTVTAVLRVSQGNLTRRTTMTRMLRMDPSLTATSRFGPPELTVDSESVEPHSTVLAMAATGGLLTGLLVVCVMLAFADTKRPLPKWMPRTIAAGKQPKSGVASSKRATVGGIPVAA